MIRPEWDFFEQHKFELCKKYSNKVVVIAGQEVVGVFESELDAYYETKKRYQPGSFIVQRCSVENAGDYPEYPATQPAE